MKRYAIPAVILAAAMFAGCSPEKGAENKAPAVVGVKDVQCIVNSTIDFLDGVAALDREDGDITPKLEITVTPSVEVKDGYATFTEVGEYTVNYTVSDKEGRTARKKAYVDVKDRETYKSFAMPEGFSSEASGSANIKLCGMKDGKFVLKAEGGEVAEDVILKRTFNLAGGTRYTFTYKVNSDKEGKIRVAADGELCAELIVKEGDNDLVFTHTVPAGEEGEQDVEIELYLGGLGDFNMTVGGVGYEYPQEEGKMVDLTEGFTFRGRVLPRIDNADGSLPLEGNAWSTDDGNAARLEIKTPTGNDEKWRGGMFINTGVELKAGVTYNVSFRVECDEAEDREEDDAYEVVIQRGQWDEYKYETIDTPSGEISRELTPTNETAGALWIYVASGSQANGITLSDLKVIERLGAIGNENFAITDFTEFHNDAYDCAFSSNLGSFTYEIGSFSAKDSDMTVTSPSFFVAGSGGNYVITFRAKATAPVEMIVAGPVSGGWDPTLMWSRVNLSEEERVYTFFCNNSTSDREHNIVWQFGSGANQQYQNVRIEISDIRVCLKNGELDI